MLGEILRDDRTELLKLTIEDAHLLGALAAESTRKTQTYAPEPVRIKAGQKARRAEELKAVINHDLLPIGDGSRMGKGLSLELEVDSAQREVIEEARSLAEMH